MRCFALRRADQCSRCGCHKGWIFGERCFGWRAADHDWRCAKCSEDQDSQGSVDALAEFLRAQGAPMHTKPCTSSSAAAVASIDRSGAQEVDNLSSFRKGEYAPVDAFSTKMLHVHQDTEPPQPRHDYEPLKVQLPSRILQVVAVSGEVVLREDSSKFPKIGDLRNALIRDDSSEVQLLLESEVLTDECLLVAISPNSEIVLLTMVRTRKQIPVVVRIGNLKGEGSAFGIDGQPITLRMFWTFQEQVRIVVPGLDGETSLRELLFPVAQELETQNIMLPASMRQNVLAVRDALAANSVSRLSRYIRFIQKSEARGNVQLGRGVPWNDLELIGLNELDTCSVASLEDVNGSKRINMVLAPDAPAERNQKQSKECKQM